MTQSFSLPLPEEIRPAGGFLSALNARIPVTGGPPPSEDEPWDPMADAPFNMISTLTLRPTRPPARHGWEHLDRCPVCHAQKGQACRDMRYPDDSGRTVQRAHRGRQVWVSEGYGLFLANRFRPIRSVPDQWFPAVAGSALLARAVMSDRLPDLINGLTGYLRSVYLTVTVSKPRRSPRLRRMHTMYPHRRRPRA